MSRLPDKFAGVLQAHGKTTVKEHLDGRGERQKHQCVHGDSRVLSPKTALTGGNMLGLVRGLKSKCPGQGEGKALLSNTERKNSRRSSQLR